MRSLAVLVVLTGCTSAAPAPVPQRVGTGGCTIVKQASTGEYPTAQLAKFGDGQHEVCKHIVDAWNVDTYLTGTGSRFRCECPPR